MNVARLEELIGLGESVDREFKSDRNQIRDATIYEEVVALANTDGGVLLIGVEDDGAITGARPRHGSVTEPLKLRSAIFNNTVPSVNTRITIVEHPKGSVIAIEVDPYPEPCATTGGKSLQRTITSDGRAQTVPFYPRDQRSKRVDLGLLDFCAQRVDGATFEDLDPLEFERLRQTIVRLRGDAALLSLPDADIAKALRLVETVEDRLVPNVAGLLLLGRESRLTSCVPTHEAFFQVLDRQGDVRVNEHYRGPLLKVLQDIEERFRVRNEEREFVLGLFRVPIPNYSDIGFREAVNNAFLHRDYTQLGSIYVQLHDDHLLITNPGGFPQGVTVANILVHEPKPRNPRLAEAFRRIGLVEQTGRGVDKIFIGQLRYGRPAPDYSRSDVGGVRVVLHGGNSSLEITRMIFEVEGEGPPLAVEELLVINRLALERRIKAEEAAQLIQRDVAAARAVLEQLNERGLIEARGEGRSRVYHLSARLYRELGQPEGYVHTHGIDRLRHEALVIEYLQAHGRITRGQIAHLLGVSSDEARGIIRRMTASGKILPQGPPRRWRYYVLREPAES